MSAAVAPRLRLNRREAAASAGLRPRARNTWDGLPLAPLTEALLTESLDGQVVGFGGAAGENHLGRGHAKGVRHRLPGLIHRHCRRQPRPMAPLGGVGKLLTPVGHHDCHHLGITGGGGVVVQVGDGLAWSGDGQRGQSRVGQR